LPALSQSCKIGLTLAKDKVSKSTTIKAEAQRRAGDAVLVYFVFLPLFMKVTFNKEEVLGQAFKLCSAVKGVMPIR
tara:strand:- start:1946 stop:2173 length:228 start_codon:yes stop_codon:yes gene_type:complete